MCEEKIHLFELSAVLGFYLRQRRAGMWSLKNDFLLQAELVVAAHVAHHGGRLRHIGVRILRRGLIGLELLRDPAAEGYATIRPFSASSRARITSQCQSSARGRRGLRA